MENEAAIEEPSVVYMYPNPTAKEQLVAWTIGMGVCLASVGIIAGVAYTVDKVELAMSKRRRNKLAKKAANTPTEE